MTVPEIDVVAFHAVHAQGASVLDVRQPDEYDEYHVPGAVLVPLAELAEHLELVPRPQQGPLYVICAVGGRSRKAAEFLQTQGIDAVNVAGGSKGWLEAGFDVVSGTEPG